MNRYLWCEDSRSGFQFWRAMIRELFPDINVESKGSNSGLRKAVSKINSAENQYYIIMDTAVDNPEVLRENKRLAADIAGKDNVHVIRLHSFEYAVLSFELLEQWVFAKKDKLRDQRQELLSARSLFIRLIAETIENAALLAEYKSTFSGYDSKNSEQIAAKLLYEITRNTGFETNKSKLGECFVNRCCEWEGRQDDDICGLDECRINASEKAILLMEHSPIKEAFERAGLQHDNSL